jgi:hypothetical protein
MGLKNNSMLFSVLFDKVFYANLARDLYQLLRQWKRSINLKYSKTNLTSVAGLAFDVIISVVIISSPSDSRTISRKIGSIFKAVIIINSFSKRILYKATYCNQTVIKVHFLYFKFQLKRLLNGFFVSNKKWIT